MDPINLILPLVIPLLLYLLYHLILFPLVRSDLRSIPGPLLAKLTDLYRLWLVRTGSVHEHHLRLHQRYGPFVRLGPNNVSVGSPLALPILYNTRTRYPKSAFYPVIGNVAQGKVVPTIFTTQDESVHEAMKRPIAQVYAMTNLKTYEPLVESTESLFFSKLERLADEKTVLDLATWFHWFATDVIMEITFGKRLGFLDQEEDVDGIIQTIADRFSYVVVVGQMPWLDKLWHKNPLVGFLSGLLSKQRVSPVLNFALQRIEERTKERRDQPSITDSRRDFLTRFLDIKDSHPNISDFWIIAWCQQNVQAGSDSTATTLTAVIYYLLKNPNSMETLLAEIDNANLPSPVPWDMANKLPYLDACIKEALRMTPAVGIPLERVAPAGGIELCGKYFQSGTVLGVNAWVVHMDQEVYGADAAHWRPGRPCSVSHDNLYNHLCEYTGTWRLPADGLHDVLQIKQAIRRLYPSAYEADEDRTLMILTPRSFLFAVVANVGPGGASRTLAVAYRQHHDEYNSQTSWGRVHHMVIDTLALIEILSDPANRAPLEAERALAEDWYRRSQGNEPLIHERPSVPDTAQPPFVSAYKRREPGQQQPPLPWRDDAPSKFPFIATCVLLALLRDGDATGCIRTRPGDVQFQPLSTLFRADCTEYGLVILDISDFNSGVKYGITAFPMRYMAEVEYHSEMTGWDPIECPSPEKKPDIILVSPRSRELLSISQWVSKHYYWSGLEEAPCILKLDERPLVNTAALDYIWPPELEERTQASSKSVFSRISKYFRPSKNARPAPRSPSYMAGYTIVDEPPRDVPMDHKPASPLREKQALTHLQILDQFPEKLRQRLEEVPDRLGPSKISSHVLRVAYTGQNHLNWVAFGSLPPGVIAAAVASDELRCAFALSLCVNALQLAGDGEERESDLIDLAVALAQSTGLQQLCFLQQPDRNHDDVSARFCSQLLWLWERVSGEDLKSLRLRTIHSTSALSTGLCGREFRALSAIINLDSSFISGTQVFPIIHLFTFVSPQRENIQNTAADYHIHPTRPGYSNYYCMNYTGLSAESFAVRFLGYLRSLGPDSDPDKAILRVAYHGAFSSLASVDDDNDNDDNPPSPPRGPPPRPPPLQSWPDQLGVRPIPAGFFDDELAPDDPSRVRLGEIPPGSWVILMDQRDRRDRFSDDDAFLQYSFIRIRRPSPETAPKQQQQQKPAPVFSSVDVVGGLTDFLRETVPETNIATWEKRLEEVERDLVSALTRSSPPSTPSSMRSSTDETTMDKILRRLNSASTENTPPETDISTGEGPVVEVESEHCIGVRVMAESRVHTLLNRLL
ncbi:hypothetical protein FE257_000867 [Aspergillus nanangensis]|uniref:Cytochrome P450 n=1 Tax=Aspergillus nanangensis TaxID=2582783 RepID=A0AAD4CFY5_ASPNN|nr:hypothetical protein FE257_000867 [Aspergillus nanangensis]